MSTTESNRSSWGNAPNGSKIAGIYCRLSFARYGDTTKVDDQERICRELAAMRNWTVPDDLVFCDNNRSAWQKNRKRPAWDRMVECVKTGRLSNLVNYHGDRLLRQPWDLELLLNFADNLGVVIVSPTGEYQLDVAHDRFVLRILTAKACLESDDTSRRKKAGFARMALEGRAPTPGGRWGRGFGYERDGRIHIPLEAAALREAADRVLGGETLAAIAAEVTRRGIMSASGKPLTYASLRRILTRPRTAGLLADGSQGNWEGILDRATWEAVGAELGARHGHRTAAPPRYLLSGIAGCGVCDAALQVHYTGRAPNVTAGYGCPGCRKIHRSMRLLDAYVTARTVARLGHPGNPAGHIPEAPGLAAQFAALAAQQREAQNAVADPGSGERLHLLLARLDGIDHRLAQLRELAGRDADGRLRDRHAGVTDAEFGELPLPVRRSLVSACFGVTVLPSSRRGPGFRTEDVRLDPR